MTLNTTIGAPMVRVINGAPTVFIKGIAFNDDGHGVLALFRAGRMNYEEADETIEFVEHRGDLVVIMGAEVYTPRDTAAHSGSIVNRRFTDVWRCEHDGAWRLTIRQATITSID